MLPSRLALRNRLWPLKGGTLHNDRLHRLDSVDDLIASPLTDMTAVRLSAT